MSRHRHRIAKRPQPEPGEDPLVSIVVATYNRPQMVGRAVRSVLDQYYRHVECVVVNDGGEDIAGQMAALGDQRLHYFNKPNGGLASARNYGLDRAEGELIGFLDDDDWLLPEHVRTLELAIREEPCAIAYSNAEYHVQRRRGSEYVTLRTEKRYDQDFDPLMILVQNVTPANTLLSCREVFDGCRFDESYPVLEDWEWLIRASRVYRPVHVRAITAAVTDRGSGSSMMNGPLTPFLVQTRRIYANYNREAANNPQLEALRQQRLAGMVGTVKATALYTHLIGEIAASENPVAMTEMFKPMLMSPFWEVAEQMREQALAAGDPASAEVIAQILKVAQAP